MRRMNVLFPEQKDEAAFIEIWLKHRKFSVPKINSALNGSLEFMDSSLMVGTDKDGKRIHTSDAYWPERDDFDNFWGTPEGADVIGNLRDYWPKFGPKIDRLHGLLPSDVKVIAGVERPVEAAYGLTDLALPNFAAFATELISRPEKPWQVELYRPRVSEAEFEGLVVVTLSDQAVWEGAQSSLADQLLDFAKTQFLGLLRTPELEDVDHPRYDRAFSQTQRGIRKNALPTVAGSGDGGGTG